MTDCATTTVGAASLDVRITGPAQAKVGERITFAILVVLVGGLALLGLLVASYLALFGTGVAVLVGAAALVELVYPLQLGDTIGTQFNFLGATLDVGRRTGIAEVENGYDEKEARLQGARCLVCHVQTIYDPEKCVLCSRCVDVCPEYCLAIVPFEDLELDEAERALVTERANGNGLPLSAMVKDDDKCIRCGLCAVRCPTDAMTMERFTITERLVPKTSEVSR